MDVMYHRSINFNSFHHQSEHSSFYRQFKGNNSIVSIANFSGLSIDNKTLESFLDEHSKTIQYLDISNCPNLSPKALNDVNSILIKVTDIKEMYRTLKIYEIINGSKRLIVDKYYHNGVLTTRMGQNGVLKEEIGIFPDDCYFTERMGAFIHWDLNGLNGLQSKKIKEMFGGQTLRPLESYQTKDEEKKITKRIEIKSWQECPLHTLIIGKSTNILPESLELKENDDEINYIINPLLGLKKLVIHEFNLHEETSYLKHLITPSMRTTLQHLDLSNCSTIFDGESFVQLENLRKLVLYNCSNLDFALLNIIKLKKLRYLDISASHLKYGHCYKDPIAQLALIADNLLFLTRLDISGTNLAGPNFLNHIPGLNSRQTRFFKYLGLYNTSNAASFRENIPANTIAGNATEVQIITACLVYIDRLDLLKRALNDLSRLYENNFNYDGVNRSCQVILKCMKKHLKIKMIQHYAMKSFFHIVKSGEAKQMLSMKTKKQIVSSLCDVMNTYNCCLTILKNGMLILEQLEIQSLIIEFTRLAKILTQIVTNHDEVIERKAILLLNLLTSQADKRTEFDDLGVIQKMLSLIELKLQNNICDEILENAWRIMRNVTDETSINCERFLDYKGMTYFVKCIDTFQDRPDLLRNIMGLLLNVSQCANLRSRLMRSEYIQRFTYLLDCRNNEIEIGYSAAGILSYIASDGAEFWIEHLKNEYEREEIIEKLKEAISNWTFKSQINIKYKSLEPIIYLLKSDQSEAQYWAVWTLANLTRVQSGTYYRNLLNNSNGIQLLEKLISNKMFQDDGIKTLAQTTLYQYKNTLQNLLTK